MRELVPCGGAKAQSGHSTAIYDDTILLFNVQSLTQKLRDGVLVHKHREHRKTGQWALQRTAVPCSIHQARLRLGYICTTLRVVMLYHTTAVVQSTPDLSYTENPGHTVSTQQQYMGHGREGPKHARGQCLHMEHGADQNMRKILLVCDRRNGGHRISICALRNS